MVCLTSWGSQGLPVYTVGARGWHPDRGLSLGRTSIPPLTSLPHEIGDWRSEMKIGERASLL